MLIGVPREIKSEEYRVGLLPGAVRELVNAGHGVIVESKAGAGIGCDDEAYERAGATIGPDADEIFARADMIVKVKEPQQVEIARLRPGQVLFIYLHLVSASRRRPVAGPGSCRFRHRLHCVRDRNGCRRAAAAAGADERDRRAHVRAGGRALP